MSLTYKGYAGKVLQVDLSNKKTSNMELTDDFVRKYLGGNGFAARLLYDQLSPDVDPLSPSNMIAFMTGPLVGTGVSMSGKFYVASKSPMTNAYFDGVSGGGFGEQLKYAGFDGVTITGRSENPVYLFINDGAVEFKDASPLWGKETTETQEAIQNELGDPKIQVVCIGPTGEKLGKMACIQNGTRSVGRGGSGAVMGSKNLKAIAVKGSGSVDVADKSKFSEWTRNFTKELLTSAAYAGLRTAGTTGLVDLNSKQGTLGTRNWQQEYIDGWENIGSANMTKGSTSQYVKFVKNSGCPRCPLACGKVVEVTTGPYTGAAVDPEYETLYALGSCCGNTRLDAIIEANRLCDELGMDTMSVGVTIAFAMECYERGLITKNDTDGIELKFGNFEAIVELTKKIAAKEGFGKILSDGSRKAAEQIGGEAVKYSMQTKGLEFAGHSPRGLKSMSLAYATGTRGGSHHDSRPSAEYGALDRRTVEGKAKHVYNCQHMCAVGDSMVICRFAEKALGLILTDKYVEPVNIVTGFNLDLAELNTIGERIFNLERAFNIRCGLRAKDDDLPDRIKNEPIPEGPSKGMKAEPDFTNMKKDLYEFRGWDKETGIPKKEKLAALGLDDVAKDLEGLQ